jgi:hydrogenase nickel incorporation protein HypB
MNEGHEQERRRVPVVQKMLSANDQIAADNRAKLESESVFTVNVMSSPGSGKTTLLMATIEALGDAARVGVIEGDVASQVDADRIAETGAPVVQINTGGGCHLDAPMVNDALRELPLEELELLFIENVGNLICPVSCDLGQSARVGLLSVPEGHDKPYKYPAIFEAVDLIVVTKADLMPYMDFDLDAFQELVRSLNPGAPVIVLSAKTGEGMSLWLDWLKQRV